MSKIRNKYLSLKDNAIRIQRAWRNYSSFKQENIRRTQEYFESQIQG